jgi:hypothetical protein
VPDLDDNAPYMLLATGNSQSELTALERGMHALRSGLGNREYARSVGLPASSIDRETAAAQAASGCPDVGASLSERFSQLVEMHAAPYWLWPSLG